MRASRSLFRKAALLGNEDTKAALKRVECDLVIKDMRGKQVGCF